MERRGDRAQLLTRSMLCCRRSFMRTTSCCLKSSFSGSGNDGGGVICKQKHRFESASAPM